MNLEVVEQGEVPQNAVSLQNSDSSVEAIREHSEEPSQGRHGSEEKVFGNELAVTQTKLSPQQRTDIKWFVYLPRSP
jgi:hypothetical protein